MGFFVLVQLFICLFVVFWVFFCSNVIWSGESLWNGIKLNSASESAEASSACVLNMLIQSRHSRKAGFNLIYIPITPLCDFMFVCFEIESAIWIPMENKILHSAVIHSEFKQRYIQVQACIQHLCNSQLCLWVFLGLSCGLCGGLTLEGGQTFTHPLTPTQLFSYSPSSTGQTEKIR